MDVCYNKLFKMLIDEGLKKGEFRKKVGISEGTLSKLSRNENVSEALIKTDAEKNAYLMDYVNTNPDKFNKIVADKNINTRAFIETLIVRGELVRSEFNQQISTANGTLIGSNMNGAIAFFNNPDNKDMKELFENKLKMF